MRRRIAIGGLLALVLAGLLWWRLAPRPSAGGPAEAEQRHVVQPQPFTATLAFAGRIAAGEAVSVTAPFDAGIEAVALAYGNHVQAGDLLLRLSLDEVIAARDQAEAAYLKAARPAATIARWAQGPEAAAARRRAELAALDLARIERQAIESRRLLDKGLIPRNEQDGIEQQLAAQRLAAAAARDELSRVLAQGDAAALRVATLERGVAGAALARAQGAVARAQIRAPASGILLPPPSASERDAQGPLHPGGRVSQGQLVAVIARDGALAAQFEVDEADVNALSAGLPVLVTGPGFPGLALRGRIAAIAADAAEAGGAQPRPRFVARAVLAPLSPEDAARIRIGMTAAVAVITYSRPRAIVVPAEAVMGSAPQARVRVRTGKGVVERSVRIGRVAPTGVEILGGLSPGETVVWQPAAVAEAGPAGAAK